MTGLGFESEERSRGAKATVDGFKSGANTFLVGNGLGDVRFAVSGAAGDAL